MRLSGRSLRSLRSARSLRSFLWRSPYSLRRSPYSPRLPRLYSLRLLLSLGLRSCCVGFSATAEVFPFSSACPSGHAAGSVSVGAEEDAAPAVSSLSAPASAASAGPGFSFALFSSLYSSLFSSFLSSHSVFSNFSSLSFSRISGSISLPFLSFLRRGRYFNSSIGYSRTSRSSPSRLTITFTVWRSTFTLCTVPFTPSSICVTISPWEGRRLFRYSYVSSSFFRQHIRRPHTPEILVGFSERFCSFAILIDTGINSAR